MVKVPRIMSKPRIMRKKVLTLVFTKYIKSKWSFMTAVSLRARYMKLARNVNLQHPLRGISMCLLMERLKPN